MSAIESLSPVKKTVDRWTDEERIFASHYLRHLARRDSAENRADLQRRMDQFGEGRKFSLEQVERLHDGLADEGI